MRFSQRLKKQVVPEWESCYINYRALKSLLKLVKTTTSQRLSMETTLGNRSSVNSSSTNTLPAYITSANIDITENHKIVKQANQKAIYLFTQTLSQQQQLFLSFSAYKMTEIQLKLNKAISYKQLIKQDKKYKQQTLYPYLQHLFIQAYDLSNMYETNMQIQRRIIDKFQLQTYGYCNPPQVQVAARLDIKRINKILRKIQQFYIKTRNTKKIRQNRERLHQLASDRIDSFKQSLIIGIMVGTFITACIFLALILIYFRNTVQTDPIFNQDFPTWRGIALFVIYMWIIGINLHHYQKFSISYRNIFENHYTNYSTSKSIFIICGFFSTLIIALFVLYVLDVANLIKLQYLNPQLLPIFVWLPFIAYLLNPISIFYRKSRNYMFKYLWKSLISFAIPITYPIVYTTDQFLSLLTPIKDTFQTICYYSHFNSTEDKQESIQDFNCSTPASIAIFVFSTVIFCYRIMQCIKCGFQVKPYNKFDFLNALKYVVALISSILSYVLAINRDAVLPAWIVFGVATSIYTFVWDVKFDWLLFEKGTYRLLLRDKLIYNKKMYYILIVLNFFLRCSWVLTISTKIVDQLLGSPEVFLLLFTFFELVRRGIWNMLSVQAQHYKNCQQLSSIPKSFYLLDQKISNTLTQKKDLLNNNNSLQRLGQIQHRQLQIVRDSFQNKNNQQNFIKIKQKVSEKTKKSKQIKLYKIQNDVNDLQLIQYLYKMIQTQKK